MKHLLSSLIFISILSYSFAQENCSNAIEIQFEEYSTCGQIAITSTDLTGAIPSTDLPLPICGNFDGSTNDLWYSITVPDEVSELAFHAFNSPVGEFAPEIIIFKPSIAIYSGSPGSLNLLNCFYNEGGPLTNGEIRFETVDGLTPGQDLYIRVWDMENNEFPFFIAASVRTEIPEHSCESPALLGDGGCNILAPKGTIDAPEDCGWNVSDNTIYYYFVVNTSDLQPVVIDATYVFCFENGGENANPNETELQMALYKWNGTDCSWIGGSTGTGNDSTYVACQNGTGSISIEENLNPGLYMIALDGYSVISGTSLCTFEFDTNVSNEVTCPNDTIVCHFQAPITLNLAQPAGGEYTCTSSPYAITNNFFYPEVCSGPQEIIYSLGPYTCDFIIYDVMYPSSIPDIEICLVTVDENNHNKIMWEKPVTDSLEEFRIYRYNGTDFIFCSIVNYNDDSFFIDEDTEPQTLSYRYKISGFSTCGFESEQSDFHQTVLLNMTEETDSWYLSWTPYIGVDNFTINILRGSALDDLEVIASYGSEVTEYTDNDPPDGFVYYQIEVVLDAPCDLGKSISSLYSNVATNDPDYYILVGLDNQNINESLSIFPNPTKGSFKIESETYPAEISIFDISGRPVKSIENYSGNEISVRELSTGSYFVKLRNIDGTSIGKLVVE